MDHVGLVPKRLFIMGLCLFIVPQLMFNLVRDFGLPLPAAIDIPHWFLIISVLLMVPLAGRWPKDSLSTIGAACLILGIAAVIGMCVIDFVFWATPPGDAKDDLIRTLVNEKLIWGPFMTWGPGTVFLLGVTFPALSFFTRAKHWVAIVILGSLLVYFGTRWFNPIGYVLMVIGYWPLLISQRNQVI